MFRRKVQASLDNKSIQGEYVGISLASVRDGGSFEECQMTLSVGKDGIDLDSLMEIDDSSSLSFSIHFSPEWVFHLKNWGVDHCLSLRQTINSDLAQLIFDFTPSTIVPPNRNSGMPGKITGWISSIGKRIRFDACMYLGEGMFVPLGFFLHKEKRAGAEAELLRLYDIARDIMREEIENGRHINTDSAHLLDLDIGAAQKVMGSQGMLKEKIEVLHRASHNLWTAGEDVINERIEIIAMGLKSEFPEVRIKSLDTFVLGGRVTQGVPLLVDFFHQGGFHDATVFAKAVDAVTCLLYEAHSYNKEVGKLFGYFQTTDVRKIHEISKGVLTPDQTELINTQLNKRPSMRWTLDDQRSLRSILENAIDNGSAVRLDQAKECVEALKKYPLPMI